MKNLIKTEILASKVVIIMRGVAKNEALLCADALYKAGIRVLEVTMNTPNAAEIITALNENFGEKMHIGAGTVTTLERAIEAKNAGATFFIAPDTNPEVISYANENGILMIPGALTPTEITTAKRLGGDIIKIFPLSSLGAAYVKDVLAPIDDIPVMAVGGVNINNAKDFIKSGAIAVGLGSAVVRGDCIKSGNYDEIERIARELLNSLI